MPRPRPLYLIKDPNRHGKTRWYVRQPGKPKVQLHAEFGTKLFFAQYAAAMAGKPVDPPSAVKKASRGTLRWLWQEYKIKSGEWTGRAKSTRSQRENVMIGVLDKSGDMPIEDVTSQHIVEGRDRRAATPTQSKCFMVCMRQLFAWALLQRLVEKDPCVGVKLLPKKKGGEGFAVWDEDEVEQYQKFWPIGTKERVWMDVLLYTGLRRGDANRLGKQHVKKGIATLRTEKSGGAIEVTLPILPILQKTLDAGPVGDLTFIVGASGRPMTKESFGNAFKEACVAAGIDEAKKAAHGLRKTGATRAAENGATVLELEAIFGWEGGGMAALYTKSANRKKASKAAMVLMAKAAQDPDANENKIASLSSHPRNRWDDQDEKAS